jgi:hypothetical protein
MNNQWMDWRKLRMGFAKQFASQVGATCFVPDDTDIEKKGERVEIP